MHTWVTREGLTLEMGELTEDELALFQRAKRFYENRADMLAISRLYLGGDSVLYKGRTGAEVVQLPLYKAIKDMAKRRGLEDGLLSDGPGARPPLDSFRVNDGKPN